MSMRGINPISSKSVSPLSFISNLQKVTRNMQKIFCFLSFLFAFGLGFSAIVDPAKALEPSPLCKIKGVLQVLQITNVILNVLINV